MIELRFFFKGQVGEAGSHVVTRENYEVCLQVGMLIYRLNKARS